jgi:uncharacterized protein
MCRVATIGPSIDIIDNSPVLIDTVLLKVASRCNLDCSYCYVYHMGDDSWRSLPKIMSVDLVGDVASQLRDLAQSQGRPFSIVLHGGEPLLLGRQRLKSTLARLRSVLGREFGINIQTNGVLITPEILDICAGHGIRLSVSVDGPADVHDALRRDLRNNPSHARVMKGIRHLKNHPQSDELFSGVLAVVDPKSSSRAVFDFFKSLGIPSVDFLYRDGNHSDLPAGKRGASSIEYGKWMSEILDLYLADPAPFRIRMLDDMMRLLLGGVGVKEGVGLTDYGILVIDTDGSIKKNDTLKSSPLRDTFDSAWHISSHQLVAVAKSTEFSEYHSAQRPSSAQCEACPLLSICGGGMLTHRYKEDMRRRHQTGGTAESSVRLRY